MQIKYALVYSNYNFNELYFENILKKIFIQIFLNILTKGI